MGHGRIFTPKRCSRVGFTDVLGMGHGRIQKKKERALAMEHTPIIQSDVCANVTRSGQTIAAEYAEATHIEAKSKEKINHSKLPAKVFIR
eukprot:scaffold13905_cov119-Skeletonema_marinoi.AAC.4